MVGFGFRVVNHLRRIMIEFWTCEGLSQGPKSLVASTLQ